MCLKTDKKKSPEVIKEELLSSCLENINENESAKLSNSSHQKYKLLLKGGNKKMVRMAGKQK